MTIILVKILLLPVMIPLLLVSALVFGGRDKEGTERWSLSVAWSVFVRCMRDYFTE